LGVEHVFGFELRSHRCVMYVSLSVCPSVPLITTNFSTATGRICLKIWH